MKEILDFNLAQSAQALQTFAQKCRHEMKQRWPDVDFDSDTWPIQTLYHTTMLDVRFGPAIIDFTGKDASYLLACRCLLAQVALEGKIKTPRYALTAWRLLRCQALPLAALRRHHLSDLEEKTVAATSPTLANLMLSHLTRLSRMLNELSRRGVISHLGWGPNASTRAGLKKSSLQWQKQRWADKSIDVLNRQIEGLSDATKAMILCDERLSAIDRSAIAVANIMMCAPSRINEPLWKH